MIIFWKKDDSNNKKISLNKDKKIILNNLSEYNNLEDETNAIKISISKSENLCENYEIQDSFISNESFIELFKDSESTEFESFSNNNLKKKEISFNNENNLNNFTM
jgi:hypothetical protein